MNKLIVICGKSGVGKSTIEKLLTNDEKFDRIISTTSRPRRIGEIDGVDYHFVTKTEFEKMIENNEMLEHSYFNNWFYGMRKGTFDLECKSYVAVLNPTGVKNVIEELGKDNVYVIYLYVNDRERVLRTLNREHNLDIKEMCRRFLADEKDFNDIEKYSLLKINNVDITQTVEIIKRNIREC
jgi:guanylate kinase